MKIKALLEHPVNDLTLRLAAYSLVLEKPNLVDVLDKELRLEVEKVSKWLNSLPDGLGTILAWDVVCAS